jgi:hypothetical protein
MLGAIFVPEEDSGIRGQLVGEISYAAPIRYAISPAGKVSKREFVVSRSKSMEWSSLSEKALDRCVTF